jgi:hypothetical protein
VDRQREREPSTTKKTKKTKSESESESESESDKKEETKIERGQLRQSSHQTEMNPPEAVGNSQCMVTLSPFFG